MDANAANFFMRTDRLNCAQTVLKLAEKFCKVDVETMRRFAKYGCGEAEGGACGALYAAIHLAANQPAAILRLKQEFNAKAGGTTCKVIKQKKMLSCGCCIDLAVEILSQECANKKVVQS